MFSTPLKPRDDFTNSINYQTDLNTQATENDKESQLNANSMVSNNNPQSLTNSLAFPSQAINLTGNNINVPTEHIKINGLASIKPLELASKYIDHLHIKDANTPILDERSYYNNGLNYNFSRKIGGLGPFTPFERQQILNIPDEILKEAANTQIRSDMGIFPEIDRCWITIDNKLILWNISNDTTSFKTIEDIKHTIVKVALVRPKPNTFVSEVKYLLLIATPFDVYLLAIAYDKLASDLRVFNTGMCVSLNGINIVDMLYYEKTGQVFFSGYNNGLNIWELQYSSSDDWFNSKCNKVCLTQSNWSSLVPTRIFSKIPGTSLIHSLFEESSKYTQETIVQLTIDQSRGILYSLSSKSTIRAYMITGKSLEGPMTIEPSYITRIIGTTTARNAPILSKKYMKVTKVIPISYHENNNLYLVAITVGGVRLYFNGSVDRSRIEALRLESIKFAPSSVTPQVYHDELLRQQEEQEKRSMSFYSSLISSESVLLKFQKKSSVLLETTNAGTIISPGIFFAPVIKKPQKMNQNTTDVNVIDDNTESTALNKLFVSVPDYGILKNRGKYVENATFLDTTGPVKQIVSLTPSFNATNKPTGYANLFASQYTTENLRIAVLTNSAIEIYKYRNPDEVFESLIENPLPFILNYGLAEACSTALFLTCKANKSELLRSTALTFFTVGIPGIIDIKATYNRYSATSVSSMFSKPTLSITPQRPISSLSQPSSSAKDSYSLDDVVLSARFYGIALLITRLFRDIWDQSVFIMDNTNKIAANINVKGSLISNISISKLMVEYYLSSINILNEFFMTYNDTLTKVSTPSINADGMISSQIDKTEEVANQAENIAVNSLVKICLSIKESLSFLNVLYDESELDGFDNNYLAFRDIMSNLSLDVQKDLGSLKFKDLFAPNDQVKSLVREILLSIINRSISRGASIENTASSLQLRCGSFCSGNDILGFRAIEHLKKAKEVGLRDYDTLSYHLNSAIRLFERIVDDLSIDKLKEAVETLVSLNYFPQTVQFLLTIANAVDKGKLAYQYISNGCLEHDDRKKYYEKRLVIYDMVFDTLIKIDNLASSNIMPYSDKLVTPKEMSILREESYKIVLNYKDKLFHFHMYDWLVSQDNQDKLLELDTEYILPYLEEKSKGSLKICNFLWVYHSRKSKFFEAAEILYSIAISHFELSLTKRIECLSRANGFCNSTCSPANRQQMVQLASLIQELFEIAMVQDDILALVRSDIRIQSEIKKELLSKLDGKILPISDLYNDYASPLGYHEVCLNIFKVSDFRNQEDIMNEWNELFSSLKKELYKSDQVEDSMNFINLLSNVVIKVGRNVHTSDIVFPVFELFPIICNLFYQNLPHSHIKRGSIVTIFIQSGISYSKMYYVIKDLIESSNSANKLYCKEMGWLIQEWYQSDRKLRDIISYESLSELDNYTLDNDPIELYTKKTGNSI